MSRAFGLASGSRDYDNFWCSSFHFSASVVNRDRRCTSSVGKTPIVNFVTVFDLADDDPMGAENPVDGYVSYVVHNVVPSVECSTRLRGCGNVVTFQNF